MHAFAGVGLRLEGNIVTPKFDFTLGYVLFYYEFWWRLCLGL